MVLKGSQRSFQQFDGHQSLQSDDRRFSHGPLSPNSSAPPALLGVDVEGPPSSGRSTPALDVSASDSMDTDEGSLDVPGAQAAGVRRVSVFVTDVSLRHRRKSDRRRKSCFDHVVWNLDHEAQLARKVKSLLSVAFPLCCYT